MKLSRFFFVNILVCLAIFFSAIGVSAKDEWIKARSKNFQLIGNAADSDIRGVAVRLEQFREIFRRLFPKIKFDSPIPIRVVVFKNKQSFRDFKPVNDDGEIRDWVEGYFQSGEDVNYIALSIEGEKNQIYRRIFHEYIHFLVNNDFGRAKIPPWFNEGLAEYYAICQIENNQKVTLGAVNSERLPLLQTNKLIPFETFFNTDNYMLHLQGRDGAGLFYAQAWALMHYLMQENNGARVEQLNKFIDLILNEKKPKEAFIEAFQTDYQTMERELKEYIARKDFRASITTFKNKLSFDDGIQTSVLTETQAKTVLGDLLYHTNRLNEAAAMLEEVLKSDADSSSANASLGMVKLRQKKIDEAKKYLEKAIALGDENYLAYFQYAYVLSREGMTEFGFVSDYPIEQAVKMREALKKAIAINPNFAESYNLYALISIARNENLDEALDFINRALKLAPGNQWYQMRVAEIYMHREDFSNARQIAQKIYDTAPDDKMRLYAKTTVNTINSYEAQLENSRNYQPPIVSDVTDKPLTDEELAEINKKAIREAINRELRRPKLNEKRVLGYLTKIECNLQEIDYSIKLNDRILKLSSENFDALKLTTYTAEIVNGQIDCGTLKRDMFAVITYRPFISSKTKTAGEIIAIEFVPKDFEFLQN